MFVCRDQQQANSDASTSNLYQVLLAVIDFIPLAVVVIICLNSANPY